MKNKLIPEVSISIVLIALLSLLIEPFKGWMPSLPLLITMTLVVVAFTAFVALVWREDARDEREGLHRSIAGRAGFIAGALALMVGIIVESYQHPIDPWLVISLGIMTITKLVVLVYNRDRN